MDDDDVQGQTNGVQANEVDEVRDTFHEPVQQQASEQTTDMGLERVTEESIVDPGNVVVAKEAVSVIIEGSSCSNAGLPVQDDFKKDLPSIAGSFPPTGIIQMQATREFAVVPFYKLFSFADSVDAALMLMGTLGAIANGLVKPLMTLIFGQLTNAFGSNANNSSKLVEEVAKVSLRYVFLGIGAGFAGICETACWMSTGERQAARIRALYLKSILRQDVAFFDKETNTGEVVSRMSEDTILIQDAIGEKVGKFVQLISTFLGGFVLAFIKGWRLAIVVGCVLPLLVIAGGTMAMLVSKAASRGQMAYAEAGNVVQQVVSGIRTVASFTGEEKGVKEYETALGKAYKAGIYQGLTSGLGMGFTLLILYLSYALALWYGSKLILHHGFSGGSVINVIMAILIGGMSLGQASPSVSAFAAGRSAAYKMFQVIERKPKIDVTDMDGLIINNIKGEIELRNVTFRYPARPDVEIFRNFSLKIPAGTTYALVGESGSGKSSVISLIERFYDPLDGAVLVDGIDIKTLQLKSLRRQIGLVSQEPVLFGVSILENISYGKDGATREEIESACELASAATFISKMPKGYDTHVGHRGTQLSGGQKQRIAIARAILKDPRILLLDEATSALDAESERIVQEALERLMVHRTTVIVAHRLTTIRNANSISVVQHGSIVETGTHDSLLSNSDGPYAQLIRLQEMHHHIPSVGSSSNSNDSKKKGDESEKESESAEKESEGESVKESEKDSSRRRSTLDILMIPKSYQNVLTETSRPMMRLAQLNKPEAPILLIGVFAAAANGIVFPMFGLLFSSMLGTFYEKDRSKLRKDANFWASMFVLLACGCFVVVPSQMFSFAYLGQNLIRRVRRLTFEKVVRQEIAWFDAQENSSGAVSSRLSTDAAYVRGMVGDTLALTVQNIATILAGLIIAFTATWQLALVVLSLVPLLGLQGFMHVKLMTGFSADAKVMYEEASVIAVDAIGSIRSVASFCAEEKMVKLYEEKCSVPVKNGIRQGVISGIGVGISNFVLYSSYSLSFWYGSRLVLDNKTTFEKVFKVFFAITMAAIGVSHATGLAPDLSKVRASVNSVFQMIDRKSKIDPLDKQGLTPLQLRGDIEFQHVNFTYPSRPHVQIFSDFSLSVQSGKRVALVGESGSGKSTAITLIQRFYDPDAGTVLIDELRWLRKRIGVVGQEPLLFSGTLAYNISYGRDDAASEQEIVAAAQASNAHKFISAMPQGYDTEVGERGVQLSGGQKQRIAIARALLKDPIILLLDEATSALDAESERLVQEALNRLMLHRTVVIVAHRLTTIVDSDSIAVVKNRRVVEQGKHSELLQNADGAYTLLVRMHMR